MAKKPFYKKIWFWILVIIVVGAIGSQGGKETKPNAPATSTTTTTTTEQAPEETIVEPDIVVTSTEVIDTFQANELKGKQTYTGKYAEITGKVGSIGESLGQTYITLETETDKYSLISLQCYLEDEAEIAKAAELEKGQEITILGTIGEQSINIAVNDCMIK